VGRNGIADALKRLDRLTREEAHMAIIENLKLTQFVHDVVNTVRNGMSSVFTVPLILNEHAWLDGRETNHMVQKLASGVDDIICS
jgi:hypothetical protein